MTENAGSKISCHYPHLPKGFHFKDMSKLRQRIMPTYRLLIAIKHVLPNYPVVEVSFVQNKKVERRDEGHSENTWRNGGVGLLLSGQTGHGWTSHLVLFSLCGSPEKIQDGVGIILWPLFIGVVSAFGEDSQLAPRKVAVKGS